MLAILAKDGLELLKECFNGREASLQSYSSSNDGKRTLHYVRQIDNLQKPTAGTYLWGVPCV